MRFIALILILTYLLQAQSAFDLTGRISLRTQQVSYDDESEILPDSADSEKYGKTNLIPGLQQYLNIALFGRSSNLDMTLLADINNNQWDKLDFGDINSVGRLSMNLRFLSHEVALGDFFESGSELFMQSREMRGIRYTGNFSNTFGEETFLTVRAAGGMTQRAVEIGDKLRNIYRQYETSGQYMRYVGTINIRGGRSDLFDIALKVLHGQDQENSVQQSVNRPFSNFVIGSDLNAYLFRRNLKLFAEFYRSEKDTVDHGKSDDFALRSGLDFRYHQLKLTFLIQHLGFDYFSMGYPFLENDKQGFLGNLAYHFPEIITVQSDFEYYQDNLADKQYMPTTTTQFANIGFTTIFPGIPQFSLKTGIRYDISATVTDQDDNLLKIKKQTSRFEGRLSHNFGRNRLSLSTVYLDLSDKSTLRSGTPLGTEQLIASFNFYSQMGKLLFLSGGAVYSTLELTNNQKNNNIYVYKSTRWDIIPRKLKLETNITAIRNDAENGGVQDYLSDYIQYKGEISFEYFFNDYISLKILGGTDTREFDYSKAQALQVIANEAYGMNYFNGNESYYGWIYGAELNWTF